MLDRRVVEILTNLYREIGHRHWRLGPLRFPCYSVFPNIAGALGGIVNSVQGANQGVLELQRVNALTLQQTAGGFGGGTLSLNASKISSLYQAIDEVRVNALFGLNLIKAF